MLDDAGGRLGEPARPSAGRTPRACHGTGVTLQASQPATPSAAASAAAPPRRAVRGAGPSSGQQGHERGRGGKPDQHALGAGVPIAGITSRLKTSAPAMAPIVLAA